MAILHIVHFVDQKLAITCMPTNISTDLLEKIIWHTILTHLSDIISYKLYKAIYRLLNSQHTDNTFILPNDKF